MIDARAHSLGAYKSSTFEDMQAFTEIALHITRESTMHVQVRRLLPSPHFQPPPTSLPSFAHSPLPHEPPTNTDIALLFPSPPALMPSTAPNSI
jgi:hypothetical protein